MAPRCLVTMSTVVLFCLISMLSPASAVRGRQRVGCCTSYTRTPVPFHYLKGFKEQSSLEHCNFDAIIFFTVRDRKVCADSEDDWVKKALAYLSNKLKKMSKSTSSAAGEAHAMTPGMSHSSGDKALSDLSEDNVTFSISTPVFFNATGVPCNDTDTLSHPGNCTQLY